MINYDLLQSEVVQHSYPLLFATISGFDLYGFPSADSDYDLRGVHLLSTREAIGLLPKQETVERSRGRQGTEVDLVTHDALKFFQLILKRNGYVLEQLYSPLVVISRPEHEELKAIGSKCITRHHSHHYLGFADTQWKLFVKEKPTESKAALICISGVIDRDTSNANWPRGSKPDDPQSGFQIALYSGLDCAQNWRR